MSISARRDVADGYEPVPVPRRPVAAPGETAMFRRRSAQPSRRAVLHVQAAGDPAVPADLAGWFTERALHFYLAGLRLPARAGLHAIRPGGGRLDQAFADLDAACAHLREADGMEHIIVAAQLSGALTAALWTDRLETPGSAGSRADALILYAPVLPARPELKLNISCPVLVLCDGSAGSAPGRGRPLRLRRSEPGPARLGSHVTWLQLPEAAGEPDPGALDAGRHAFFDELGRWLGAYMYGARDQLL